MKNARGRLEDLEEYIDKCFHWMVVGKPNKTLIPCSKRSRPEEPPGAVSSSGGISSNILLSIDQRLSSLDTWLKSVEVLHKEQRRCMSHWSWFSNDGSNELYKYSGQALRESVKSLTEGMTQLSKNTPKTWKNFLGSPGMRDNLVYNPNRWTRSQSRL